MNPYAQQVTNLRTMLSATRENYVKLKAHCKNVELKLTEQEQRIAQQANTIRQLKTLLKDRKNERRNNDHYRSQDDA